MYERRHPTRGETSPLLVIHATPLLFQGVTVGGMTIGRGTLALGGSACVYIYAWFLHVI